MVSLIRRIAHIRCGAWVVAPWVCCLAVGVGAMIAYETTPAPTASVDNTWPAESILTRDSGRHMLVMFVHPRCPCSRASLAELAELADDCHGRAAVHVVFHRPRGTPEGWERTGMWESALHISGAVVHCDHEGREARRFHASTSGETFLFAPNGRLLFHGGVTASRGHRGENAGRDAIASLVQGGAGEGIRGVVFGCALFARNASPAPTENP